MNPGDALRPLDVSVREHPAYAEVVASGEIDYMTHRELRDALTGEIEGGHACVLLDMSGVTFCDSTGLGVLATASRKAVERNGWLRVAAPAPGVRRTLEITSLDRLIPVYETVDEATRDL